MAGEAVNFGLKRRHAPGEIAREALELGALDLDPGHFHARQHGYQRAFEGFVDAHHARGHEAGLEHAVEAERDVGVLGGILGRLVDGHEVERDLIAPSARDFLEGNGLVIEMEL